MVAQKTVGSSGIDQASNALHHCGAVRATVYQVSNKNQMPPIWMGGCPIAPAQAVQQDFQRINLTMNVADDIEGGTGW